MKPAFRSEREKACGYGHETTPENTIYVKRARKDGSIHMGPRCRTCQLLRQRKNYADNRASKRKWARENDRRTEKATRKFTVEFLELFAGVTSFTRPFQVGDPIVWTKIKRRGKPLVVLPTNRFRAWAARGWVVEDGRVGGMERWRIARE